MGQTIVEKIAQKHMTEGPARPLRTGDFLSIRPHRCMTHDNTSAVMSKFKGIGAKKIHDPKQLVFALDHDIQNKDEANQKKYRAIEAFALSPREIRDMLIYGFKRSFFPGTYLEKRAYVREVIDYADRVLARLGQGPFPPA